MPLNERDRIEILMMIGVGDRMRTQQEVCRLFHEMHPDREPVSQSTVSRIERKYRELGHVRDAPRQGRPKINENVQQDVILSALENPHCTVRQVSRDLNIGKSSVSNIFKKVKYHPYRVRLIHELAEDDFDRRTEFCEYMMDHNNQNNGFIANILFSLTRQRFDLLNTIIESILPNLVSLPIYEGLDIGQKNFFRSFSNISL
ncbi:hypothetical protein NQ318_010337 [Aromia moschata]|uniref:DUF4817 domain-containing protein n=1 Tax=Aromia moschata TaxID=1265417 RepID=A0AAV8YFF8_9CUCU|nr:hypothetical protein NQ318_010337 [Aromia moschata]